MLSSRINFISIATIVKLLKTGIQSRFQLIINTVKQIKAILGWFKDRLLLVRVVPVTIAVPKLTLNYAYDLQRFLKYSAVSNQSLTQTQIQALITMDYHRVEKGLALKEPRVQFGAKVIERLISNLQKYQTSYGFDETAQIALNTLFTYYTFNTEQGIKDNELLIKLITLKETAPKHHCTNLQGGTKEVNKAQILESAKIDPQAFFESRHSIRQFSSAEVDMSLIEKATKMAQKTPSVCNRQSSKVYVFSQPADKQKVLSYQNGNRGFGDQASHILIVTSDMQHFISVGERNQCWIDGGMFSMSLVYALHALGLGTCCLNWSVEQQTDQALRQAAGIKDSEAVMMMVAVGHLPEKLKVAQSPRKPLHEVLITR